jgi:hypothetical protein
MNEKKSASQTLKITAILYKVHNYVLHIDILQIEDYAVSAKVFHIQVNFAVCLSFEMHFTLYLKVL